MLDYDILHEMFWERSDRLGRVTLNNRELAVELDYHFNNITRIIQYMIRQGRMKLLSRGKFKIVTYVVEDPAIWRWHRGKDAPPGNPPT